MKTSALILTLMGTSLIIPVTAQAQAAKSVADFTACRAIDNPTDRLACYDTNADTIVKAQETGELLIIDQKKAEEIQKENFGFRMPSLPKFQLPKRDKKSGNRYNIMTIKSYKKKASGYYVFYMENGQIWQQTNGTVNRAPKGADQTLHVREASMGSFLARINGQGSGLRVKRIE